MTLLRAARPEDANLAITLHTNPTLARFLWPAKPTTSAAHAMRWYASVEHILAAECDGRVVGFVWFDHFDGHNAYIVIGMVAQRGKGLATEVTRLGLKYAFDELLLKRVSTTVVAGNVAALALAEKFSTQEGRLRQAFLGPTGVQDILVFGILEPEWRASPWAQH
jgi:RimJ/RimL family protein N-acetyltransferase